MQTNCFSFVEPVELVEGTCSGLEAVKSQQTIPNFSLERPLLGMRMQAPYAPQAQADFVILIQVSETTLTADSA